MQLLTIKETIGLVDQTIADVREAVCSTMGPNGRLAFISSGVSTKTTKDGVTVAKSIKFDDPRQELINRVITEPALKTDQDCGDGTTTTILLTHELTKAHRKLSTFVQQRELERLVNMVIEELTNMSIKVDVDDPRLYAMALTSSNQDTTLAKTICDLYAASKGRYPEIDLKEGMSYEDDIERIEGRVLGMSYGNPWFGANNNGGELELRGFRAVVVDARLMGLSDKEMFEALDAARRGLDITAPLVLVVRSIEQDAVSQVMGYCEQYMRLARSREAGMVFKTLPVTVMATNFGGTIGTSMMQDLAVMLSAPMVSNMTDIRYTELFDVGSVLRLGSSRSYLTEITPEGEHKINQQADLLVEQLGKLSLTEKFSLRARFMEKRIRNLRGQLITIHVGGETHSEIKERLDRYEDVVKAVKSGLENGILPGGGIAIMQATNTAIKRYTKWEKPFGVDPEELCERQTPFIVAVAQMALAQRIQLFSDTDLSNPAWFSDDPDMLKLALNEGHILDLATGRIDTPENLGVYDTAFASITALKGGLQTAKLLANAQTLVLGDKVHSVRVAVQ